MLLAIAVATLAVLLGLLLGLAPTASRRALGPLRTLALTAVIAVVALHLLPEALGELGALGLGVFAAGLALPRWLTWLSGRASGHGAEEKLGLELGFWGLLVHHVGDGLALGAYSRVDSRSGHSHADVLFALVLHTVPLVAVVAAGYARTEGPRAAISRSLRLALASILGVLLTRLVPEAAVSGAQAWVAAGVSGLLLHGLTHDLGRDLPTDVGGRVFDLLMALTGAALGWLGAALDAHGDVVAAPVGQLLSAGIQRAALPLAVGLLLAALLATRSEGGLERYSRAAQAGEGGVFSPEAFLVTLGHLGFAFALARDLLGVLLLPLRLPFPTPDSEATARAAVTPGASGTPGTQTPGTQTSGTAEPSVVRAKPSSALARFVGELDARIDVVAAWGLLGALVAAVIRAAVPDGALLGPTWVAVLAALAFSVSVPLHAVAAPQLAFALAEKGLGNAAALLIVVVAPLAVRPDGLRPLLLLGGASLACVALGDHLPRQLATVEPALAWGAVALLGALVLRRAYQAGFRGLLRPLVHAD